MTTLCAMLRHGDGEVETEPHATLCQPCRLDLARDLKRLPRLHAELQEPPMRGEGDGGGLPFSEPALECRDQIRHDLTYWCMEVTRIRGDDAPPPEVRGDMWSTRPVYAMAGWLAGQISRSNVNPGWICYRDWAPAMAGAIGDDRARADALLHPFVKSTFEIPGADGICLHCDGRVVATVYKSDGDRRRPFIACPGCGVRWEPEQWLSYGHKVIQRREAMAS